MSAASNHVHSSNPPSLSLVAERLEAAVEEIGWGGPPLLVGIGDDATDSSSVEPLPPVGSTGDDPVADLLGYVAPADCSGLAVVAEGTGRRLVDGGEEPWSSVASSAPHRFAYVVDRAGRAGCAIRRRGGDVALAEYDEGAGDGPGGRLVDVCRRAMALPTAPAPLGTARLWLLSWLDLVLARALGRGGAGPWSDIARLHPAVTLLDEVDGPLPAVVDIEPDVLGRMGRALGAAQEWEELRRSAAAGEWSAPGITPGHAAWMDAGLFARWVIGEFLPESVYLGELADVLPVDVAERVVVVAAALEP